MSKTVLSIEKQAELGTCQNALKAPLLRVKVGKRSEEYTKTPCHWVAGASLEVACSSFSLLTASLGLTNMPLFGLQTQHIQQQTNPLSYPAKTSNGGLLIVEYWEQGYALQVTRHWSSGEAGCV